MARAVDSLSRTQVQELWGRWQSGQSQTDIAKALAIQYWVVRRVLVARGGIAPRPPCRSPRVLTLPEREGISRGLAQGHSLASIALQLRRSPSTISREVNRHGGRDDYRAVHADEAAWISAKRPKPCRLAASASLRRLVAGKLAMRWSPTQIAGWLKLRFPGQEAMHVSHETIYQTLYIQARGLLKKELMAHLRTFRRMRKPSLSSGEGQGRGQIVDAVSISQRPAEAQDRAVPGHLEGDLISGSNNSHIATLVERSTRYVMLVQLQNKTTDEVVPALARKMRDLPPELRRSLTWDRGGELARHKDFTIATDIQVYFCDPQSPWQRGSNENTNGLLRQYFPKGTDLSGYSQAYLTKVAKSLNERPRQTLGFHTPADKLNELIASTG